MGKSATPPRIADGVDQIYLLNREQIGVDPGLIVPGQELVLPPSLKAEPQKADRPAGPKTTRGEIRAEVPADPRATDTKTAKAKPEATPKVNLPDAARAAPAPAARVLASGGPSRSPVASAASSPASALAGYYADIREDANGRWLLGLATIALGLLAASLVVRKLFAVTKRNASDDEAWRPYYSPLLVRPTAQQEDASARRKGSREGSREVPEKPAATEPGPNQRPSGIEAPAPENDTDRVGLVGIARLQATPGPHQASGSGGQTAPAPARPRRLQPGGPSLVTGHQSTQRRSNMKWLLLVENHVAFRQCLALLIESRLACANIQAGTIQAGTLSEARRVLANSNAEIGLSIVDLDLPSGDAVELIEELRKPVSGAPVLALTDGRNPRVRVQAFRAGADEVLTLSESAGCFVDTAGRLGGATQRGE